MNKERLKRLIEDTLYGRRLYSGGTCIVTNVAAKELRSHVTEAVSPLEETIRALIVPQFDSGRNPNNCFIGLTDILGVYLLGTNNLSQRQQEFIDSLPQDLQIMFIQKVPIFFRWMGDDYNFDQRPSQSLIEYVSRKRDSHVQAIADAACKSFASIQENLRAETEFHQLNP